jgi:hypothetical protein
MLLCYIKIIVIFIMLDTNQAENNGFLLLCLVSLRRLPFILFILLNVIILSTYYAETHQAEYQYTEYQLF